MNQYNIHEAKTHLSALIDKAVKGDPFIIAKAGTPQVVVYAYESFQSSGRRTGFMRDIEIPNDFNSLMSDEISALFISENS